MTHIQFPIVQQFLDDPDVVEIMIVNGRHVWVEYKTGIIQVPNVDTDEVAHLVEVISRVSGRRIDALSPILDAQLPNGSRVCVVLPPIAHHGMSINIRNFPSRTLPLAAFGSESVCDEVRHLVTSRANVIVSGATSTGKTSLISAATEWFSPDERVVCVEDTAEITCRYPHAVHLQTRPSNQDGRGEITLQQLVSTSLRMRPDRLLVGEVRGHEVVDMLLALSSGHTGSWTTVHSTSAADTVNRLVSLLLRHHPQWSRHSAHDLVMTAIGAVIHLERLPHGQRHIAAVVDLTTA